MNQSCNVQRASQLHTMNRQWSNQECRNQKDEEKVKRKKGLGWLDAGFSLLQGNYVANVQQYHYYIEIVYWH